MAAPAGPAAVSAGDTIRRLQKGPEPLPGLSEPGPSSGSRTMNGLLGATRDKPRPGEIGGVHGLFLSPSRALHTRQCLRRSGEGAHFS
ncbi:hypothetical protein NDU88_008185 [Pleurodeles waltl]|uniref:Uncharacterized protein n=1 Tax=Pleurodeles waltl TaxID=8319 RepID=A0AAV7N831_PLEWA|nr:hypothetical protein NDU88_008185 [Pleurodeles waltl]